MFDARGSDLAVNAFIMSSNSTVLSMQVNITWEKLRIKKRRDGNLNL